MLVLLPMTKLNKDIPCKNRKIPGIFRVYGYNFDKDLDILVENPEEKGVYLTIGS